jgi:hypothetical protein
MEKYAIYLDLDGVMADYDAGIRSMGYTPDPALNKPGHRLTGELKEHKRTMYEAVKGTTFYADLPLLPGALDLYNLVAASEPYILTAAPKFGAGEVEYYLNPYWLGAAFHKRNWVETVLLPQARTKKMLDEEDPWEFLSNVRTLNDRIRLPDDRFICTISTKKHDFMHRKKSDHQVLIDDRPDNIDPWIDAGGIGILYTTFEDAKEQLLSKGIVS